LEAVEKDKSADTPSLGAGLALLEDIAEDMRFIHEFLDEEALGLNLCGGSTSSGVPCVDDPSRSKSCLLCSAASSTDCDSRRTLPETVLPS
jgi:hypothetical protein